MINILNDIKLGDVFDLYDTFDSKYEVIHEDATYCGCLPE